MAFLGRRLRCLVSLRAFLAPGAPGVSAGPLRASSSDALVEDNTNVLDVKGSHPLSPTFMRNAEAMGTIISRLNMNIARACEGGGQGAIERNAARGKWLPRQRIQALLDPGSPFLELSQLAGHNLYGAYIARIEALATLYRCRHSRSVLHPLKGCPMTNALDPDCKMWPWTAGFPLLSKGNFTSSYDTRLDDLSR